MTESVRVCRYCDTEKTWIWHGHRLKDGTKIYTDTTGKRWAGRRCPDCEKKRVAQAVRLDGFDKDQIINELTTQGYEIVEETMPMTVRKDGKELTMGLRRAVTDGNKVIIDSKVDDNADLYALVFQTVRICSKEALSKQDAFATYNQPLRKPRRTSQTDQESHGF